MAIKLLRPGTRHANKVFYARISVPGRRVEISTHTRSPRLARRYAEDYERRLYERHTLGGEALTVAQSIDNYIAFRRPALKDERYLLSVRALLGPRHCDGIAQADFDHAAAELYPGCSNETWNRCVYTPFQAALRHSGARVAVKRPRQKRPRHRSVTEPTRDVLIANADDADLKALLILLFYAGPRIGEAINLKRGGIDFEGKRLCFDLTKTDDEHWRPMHPKVADALRELPVRQDGRIFRWRTPKGAREIIRKLSARLGLYFTPHMARHTYADLLMEKGGSLRDLMDAGGWKDMRSAIRYTGKNVERVRKAVNRL